jgi:hypothetical protein
MKKYVFLCVVVWLLFFCIKGLCLQDKHIVFKWSFIYGELPTRNYTDEFWVGDNAACIKSRMGTTVFRFDLDKVWIINTRGKKYFEQSIEDYIKSDSENHKHEVSIHDLGWDYDPEFEWTVEKLDDEKFITGWKCRHFLIKGEADFTEIQIDLWVSGEIDIPHKSVFKDIIFKPVTRSEWDWDEAALRLGKLCPDLIVSSTVVNEPPIARTITYIKTIDKIEQVAPPEGIYEIPEGTLKVSSLEELY